MTDTLIIIPTYNEKENIKEFVSEIFKHAPMVNVLIVDDDSSDGTGVIADDIAAKDKRVSVMHRLSLRGRGYAGIDAFKEALKRKEIRFIMEMDADFSHDPKYIPRFIQEMDGNDIVIGSRFTQGGSDIYRSFLRNSLSRLSNIFIRWYLDLGVRDCSAGYRCFKRHVIESIDLDSLISRGPAVIEEILYIFNTMDFRIKEIPIIFRDRSKGKTKLGIVKLFKVFMDIVYFKNIHLSKDKLSHLRELRKFGFQLGLAMNILGAIMFYRQRPHFIWFSSIGSVNLVLAMLWPALLRPLKKALDLLIVFIGKTTNTLTMTLAFYLIFAPIAVFLKIFRIDILNEKINRSKKSYWIERKGAASSPQRYERMG